MSVMVLLQPNNQKGSMSTWILDTTQAVTLTIFAPASEIIPNKTTAEWTTERQRNT